MNGRNEGSTGRYIRYNGYRRMYPRRVGVESRLRGVTTRLLKWVTVSGDEGRR